MISYSVIMALATVPKYRKHAKNKSSATSGGSTNAESNNNTTLNNNNSHHPHELGSMSDSGSESGSHKSGRARTTAAADGKPTRVRTVLNEKQLHTLRTCYAANPRPDALMKEQLVEMTGLSPRVIRVWFQNKRCKDKKKTIQLKMQMQQEKEGRRLGYMSLGVPLVAGSPVRHEAAGALPLEVTAYQPPWKALSDFALHADLDRAPHHSAAFHHLVNQPLWKALTDFALHADLDRAPHHSAAFHHLVNQVRAYNTSLHSVGSHRNEHII
ncbi:hypothetical protein evm_000812 [Chilo suppressalis]|nr:hypothetical protein evm_000812 [Chilo suppressalis]